MRKLIFTLACIFIAATASYAGNMDNASAKSSPVYRFIPPAKDNGAKDSTTTKKKEEKPFKETILAMLLRFEK